MDYRRALFLMILTLLPSVGSFALCEEDARKRVYDHLIIRDHHAAVLEAKKAHVLFPESKLVQLALIDALCQSGEETEAWTRWEQIATHHPETKQDRRVLEMLAWGVLNKGESSTQLGIRFNSLLGAAFTHDAKAIPLLLEQLRSSNAMLRSIAIRIAAGFGDAPLKDEIARLLTSEKVWYVRLEVIQAVGALRMEELKPELKEIIGNPKTLAEEKVAAIIALVSMYDAVESAELLTLLKSERAGLRQLGCEVVTHLNLKEELSHLLPLLKDGSPDVRISALNTLALMRVQALAGRRIEELLLPLIDDPVPEVAITACYAMLLVDARAGEAHFQKWLSSENSQWRRLASAAIAVSGKYGVALAFKGMRESDDPYVRVNLALGLIGQRHQVKMASDVLFEVFKEHQGTLWMWDNQYNPLFRSLAPSRVKHIEPVPHYPIVVDQLVRLDLLSVLSIVRYPKAQEAVKAFLQAQGWGVTGVAAATLLQEGDDEALEAVRALLNDGDEKIRVQAAMIMAIVGSDPSAVHVLQEAYLHVDREMKIHILEAVAHVGDPHSIPFLLEILKEPFQVLRVVAASALIQCIYH